MFLELKQEIDVQQIRIKESEHDRSELKILFDELTHENNAVKLELDDIRQDLSQQTIVNQKLISGLEFENEKNTLQILALEDEKRTLKTKLKEADQELVNIKTEFASYKVRAQSVLRQNQTQESSNENELKEELASVLKSNEKLAIKLNSSIEKNRRLQDSLEEMKSDKEHLQVRCKELLQLLDESRQQFELVQDDNRKQSQEHQEALKMQRIQIDTLNTCYKNQIAELESKHEQEVKTLIALQKETDNENQTKNEKNRNTQVPLTDEQRINWLLMERQEGEGSESAGSMPSGPTRKISTIRNKRDLIPLDELLNTSFDESTMLVERSVSPSIELQETKEQLNVHHSR